MGYTVSCVGVAAYGRWVILMDYSQMTRQELQAARGSLESDLADYEEMASFHFANTSVHISTHEVTRERNRRQRLEDAIADIDGLLAEATP